jgi:hypothetical protein
MGFILAETKDSKDRHADVRCCCFSKPNDTTLSVRYKSWLHCRRRSAPVLLLLLLVPHFLVERVDAFRSLGQVERVAAVVPFHRAARPLQRFGTILHTSRKDSYSPGSHTEKEEEEDGPLLVQNVNQIRADWPLVGDKDSIPLDAQQAPLSRRLLLGTACIGIGSALGGSGDGDIAHAMASSSSPTLSSTNTTSRLRWQVTPVNKRTGVTVFDAERAGYKVNFVTYLSRFLLTFDRDCQFWWYQRAADIPRSATPDQVLAYRRAQFAAFSASVEVGLQEYSGPNGPETLLAALIRRYCRNTKTVPTESNTTMTKEQSAATAPLKNTTSAASDKASTKKARREREIKEARRQICLLFGLMEQNQPVESLTRQLAALDNGSVLRVKIVDGGSGYAPGYGPPNVRFPPPDAGPDYETATGRAILSPNGRLLRIDVVNRGFGYKQIPDITISPPAVVRFGGDAISPDFADTATAQAFLFRSGPNKGRIERIQLTSPGAGYTANEMIRIQVNPPETPFEKGGVTGTAAAVLEYEVSDILIVKNGTGYAVEKPIRVQVDPPPLTARVNMNDPLVVGVLKPSDLLPATTIPSSELRKKMPDPKDPNSLAFRANNEAEKGGGTGCIGRACYDRRVVAVAYPASPNNNNVFKSFRKSNDTVDQWAALENEVARRTISAATAGDLPQPINFVNSGAGAASELLSLLPSGVGLEFNALYNRYELAVDPNYQDNPSAPLWMKASARKIDPDFGPRGRSPIERDMQLGLNTYLRFILSGAICASGVHLVLTPIDGTLLL